ncbi:MAG: hypothetical protein A3H31_11000 [Gallionellales bacterium RIFCSPLOWO2_02_FULL_57_47]|nr:MAG: hypothetical protein A3H31_11000 [Gallionellales bacterium RIFCSPLOWO2_02_FULL_57_47]OGT12725.1 MAG: hypothetical protein A3J49_03145 [Gallionellales bacterium RIFCSPHIGHO2_02_FULL_57_16]
MAPEQAANMKKSLFIILALALLCCGGCSRVTIGYNHADWYLRYKINDYTSFHAPQKDEIHREVDLYMRWHRKNALPEYTRFLENFHDAIQPDRRVQAEDIARIKDDSYRLYKTTVAPFILPAARLLNTLDSRQIEELRKTLAEMNLEQKEESLSGSDQENLDQRAERTVDFVEGLVGNLSGEQEDKIREMSLRLPFATGHYIEHREANQAALVTLLNNHAGEEKIAAFLWLWLNAPEATRTPLQQQVMLSYDSATDEMSARIYALLTDRQKNRLRKKIISLIKDFQNLATETRTVRDASN